MTLELINRFENPVISFFVSFISDMNSVSNLLTREFLSDIHRICSSHDKAGHLARDEAEDDLTELKSYLLSGRGWMILRSVNTAGVEVFTPFFLVINIFSLSTLTQSKFQ